MARRDPGDGAALDPALTQKKRARRRLVGALVLGVVAAIVLPLVLDSEPRQTINDVQIEIPPRDAPLAGVGAGYDATPGDASRVGEIASAPQEAASAGTQAVPPSPATAHAPGDANSAASASAGNAASAGSAGSASAPSGASTPGGASNSTLASSPAPRANEADATERRGADANSSRSKTPAAAAPKPSTAQKQAGADAPRAATGATASRDVSSGSRDATGPRFALQVGAFANAGSARAQADRVRKAGMRPYTELVQTAQGARTRVRVGPFPTREAAEKARTDLKRSGIDSSVVGL